ncbi:MAG: GTP-binding protein [Candidatus Asgardarchaeia archaeon]
MGVARGMLVDWINYHITSKIVYYGPAMSGKTTTVKAILKMYGKVDTMKSIETTKGRTLFFDFGNLSFKNGDWMITINLWTATGQDYYYATRESVLLGVDGIVFVADASPARRKHNVRSWNELLSLLGADKFKSTPLVIELNKVDLPNALSKEDLIELLGINGKGIEIFSTVAKDGVNVIHPLKYILRKIFSTINTVK